MATNPLQGYLSQLIDDEFNAFETSSIENELVYESNQEEFRNPHVASDISTTHNVYIKHRYYIYL
jgi:hypothetical protein